MNFARLSKKLLGHTQDTIRPLLEKFDRQFGQRGRIGLLFSGGYDSTLNAILLAQAFPDRDIVFLTFWNGMTNIDKLKAMTCQRLQLIYAASKEERQNRAGRLRQVIFDTSDSMREAFGDYYRRQELGFTHFFSCIDCKSAMHVSASLYAQREAIAVVANGYTLAQSNFPEQGQNFARVFIQGLNQRLNGVCHLSTLYKFFPTREQVKSLLSYLISLVGDPEIVNQNIGDPACTASGLSVQQKRLVDRLSTTPEHPELLRYYQELAGFSNYRLEILTSSEGLQTLSESSRPFLQRDVTPGGEIVEILLKNGY